MPGAHRDLPGPGCCCRWVCLPGNQAGAWLGCFSIGRIILPSLVFFPPNKTSLQCYVCQTQVLGLVPQRHRSGAGGCSVTPQRHRWWSWGWGSPFLLAISCGGCKSGDGSPSEVHLGGVSCCKGDFGPVTGSSGVTKSGTDRSQNSGCPRILGLIFLQRSIKTLFYCRFQYYFFLFSKWGVTQQSFLSSSSACSLIRY